MKNFSLLLVFTVLLSWSPFTSLKSQIVLTNETDATILANSLAGGGVTVTGAVINCPGATQRGTFTGGAGIFGIGEGLVLTSGDIDIIDDIPNMASSSGANVDGPTDADLEALTGLTSFDACVLEFDIIPVFDTLVFNYVFASEEYCDFACGTVNDAFGFFFTGMNPAGGAYANYNIALIPGTTTPVTINNINNGNCLDPTACDGFTPDSTYYVDNNWSATGSTFDIQYDGFTTVLQAKIAVVPCETYHLKLAISDMGDGVYDSGVFIESGSLSSYGLTLSQSTSYGGVSFNAAVEGCNDGVITFVREPVTPDTVIVHFGIMGTATMGVDYPAIPDSIIILPNDSSATLTIPAYLDGIVEPTETVVIFLSTICGLTETIYDSIVLNIQDNVEAEALATGDTTICEGATIEMHGYGGSDFLWFPNTYLSSDTIYNPIFTPPNPGTYLYNLAVLLGPCSDTTQVEIQVAPGPMAYAGPNDSLCIGASLVLNGTGGVTHLWEGSNITTPDTSLSITVSPTSSGEYILTVTDAEGCIDKDTTQIEVVALPMVNAGLDATICPDGNTTLAGISGLAGYNWIPSSSLSCSNCPLPVASPSMSTTYTLIGENSFGCTDQDEVFVYVSNPNANAGPDIFTCSNEVTPMGVAPTVGYTYAWTPTTGLSNGFISNPTISLTNNTTSDMTYTYTLTATDVNGCTEVDEVEIVVVHNPIIDAGEAVTINIGESYTMNTTVESPTGNNYNWLPYNSEFMDNNTEQNPTVTPPMTTLYTMYVTNSEGCTSSDTVTIEVYIPPFVSVPNGFTPNNDNENDRLMPFYYGIDQLLEYRIYNRWGEKVFEFNNYNLAGTNGEMTAAAWDGSYKGEIQPMGTYVYYMKAKSVNNEDLFYTGNITLLK